MDEQAQCLLDVAGSVMGELNVEAVVERVLKSARDLTGARYAAVGVLGASTAELERFVSVAEGAGSQVASRAGVAVGELILDPVARGRAEGGEQPRGNGHPVPRPAMHSFLGIPIVAAGVPYGSLYLTDKAGGGQFTDTDAESVKALAKFAGVAFDHALRYAGAAQRRDELERTVAALQATTEIARAVGGQTDLDVILELIAERGRALVCARALLIELVDGDELVVAAGAGDRPAGVIGRRIGLADTVADVALRTNTTQRLELELNRARFHQHGIGQLGVRADAGLVVPLTFQRHTYGTLVVLDRLHGGPGFTAEDQRLLEAFAISAVTAVATAQSTACELHRQRLAAAEDERGRWARELHDDTLQSLAALLIRLSVARRLGGRGALDDAVGEAIEYLTEGVSNLRALVTDLRPAALDQLGLAAAVEALTDRSRRHGLEIDSSIDLAADSGREPIRYAPELEAAIYRIIQESLTNAVKHGHARRAMVEIHDDQASVQLTIRDDGDGFDPAAATKGFGLTGIRERVELLHGTVRITSCASDGTTLTASFPLQREVPELQRV